MDVDGELQSHHSPCWPGDTVSGSGINSSSRLFVQINPHEEQANEDLN